MQSRTVLDNKPYSHNLTRASLIVDAKKGPFVAYVDFREEVRFGNYFHTRDYNSFGLGEKPFWFHLENRVSHGKSWQWNQGVYRGWAGLEGDTAAFRLGRQRIAWGTGKLWNPTDVLNPYQPISVEREDRRGVDAAYFRLSLGELSQYEAAFAPQDRERDTQFLQRVRFHAGHADFSVMGGKVAGDSSAWMAGGDFAADLANGTLKGEITTTDPIVADAYVRWLAGYEYRFSSETAFAPLKDVWLLAEYYHNGAGAYETSKYDFVAVLAGRNVSMGREYTGLGLSKEFDALWTGELYAIRNIRDRSMFIGPSLKWNALTNLDLLAGAQGFIGAKASEYGRLSTIYYLQAQYFFNLL